MNKKISESFADKKAFIPFITCGDPSLEMTEKLVYAMEEAGSDLIELGIPFSDPTAEGPVIQEANERALADGVTTDKIFDMICRIRQNTDIPIVCMTYANVVFSYGTERFVRTCAQVGIDGLILPDVPFEEKDEFDSVCREYGIDLISLVTSTSHDRIAKIAREAQGFVSCVYSAEAAKTNAGIMKDAETMVRLVKQIKKIPCVMDIKNLTPEQSKAMAELADGVTASSAIVEICAAYPKDCVPRVKEYVRVMKAAISQK